jgi:hypothetical protein
MVSLSVTQLHPAPLPDQFQVAMMPAKPNSQAAD